MNSHTNSKSFLKFYLGFITKQPIAFLVLFICCFGWSIDQTVMPYVFKLFTDQILTYQGDRYEIWPIIFPILMVGLGVWILTDVMFRVSGFVASFTIPKFEAQIRMHMFQSVQEHSHQFFSDRFSGNLANKVNDMPTSCSRIYYSCFQLLFPTVMAFIIGISLFYSLHPIFAQIMLGWVTVHVISCIIFAPYCNRLSKNHAESRSRLIGRIVDSYTNHFSIRTFASEFRESLFVNESQERERNRYKKMLFTIEWVRMLQAIFCLLVTGVLLTYMMIIKWQAGEITSSDFVFIFYTSWGITVMAWIAGFELPNVFREVGICQQAMTILNEKYEVVDKPSAKPIKISQGKIEFNNVSFAYKKGKYLFHKKSLKIKPGEKVGLVGFSGSGKTTFAHLLLRLYDIQGGEILIDDQNIADVSMESLRSQISLIPQDTSLFHRSIMDNIKFARKGSTDEEAIEASRKAHCHEFIAEMDEGYGTVVGERGIKLSGGQRQRVAIARAFLAQSPLLILDEATSALDSITEEKIQQSLYELMQNKTTVVIAHRLSTLAKMDRILVFHQGELVEEGTQEELLKNNGRFKLLWDMQVGGFLPDKEGKVS